MPMLLMPGFDGTGELFSPLTAALSSRDQPVVIRYRDERTFDDYVDSVSAALPSQGAILIAESFSGPIAMGVMARYPNEVRCAVLCATFVDPPFHTLAKLARLVPTPLFGLRFGRGAILKRFCLDDRSDPGLITKALAVVNSIPAAVLAARLNMLADLQVRPLCRAIRTPILILRATGDRLVTPYRYTQLIKALPEAAVKEVEGPHLLLQSRPQQCARLIDEFVSSNIL